MTVYAKKGRNGKLTGLWAVEVNVEGKRARGYFPTRQEALEKEKEWKKKLARGEELENAKFHHKADGAPRTLHALSRKAHGLLWEGLAIKQTRYRQLDIIVDILGDLPLVDLTTSKMDDLTKLLRKRGVKDITLNKYYSCLNVLLKWGRARGYVQTLPEFDWKDEEEGRIREITENEEFRLTGFLCSYGRRDIADLVSVAIATGMRQGELISLRLDNIDGEGVHLWKTKNKKARTIPVTEDVKATLRALILSGMPTADAIRHVWDRAKKDMGLSEDKDFVFHACRHTCCTRLIRAGVNVPVVQKWMGHTQIATTLRYTHMHDGDLKDALRKLQANTTLVKLPSVERI